MGAAGAGAAADVADFVRQAAAEFAEERAMRDPDDALLPDASDEDTDRILSVLMDGDGADAIAGAGEKTDGDGRGRLGRRATAECAATAPVAGGAGPPRSAPSATRSRRGRRRSQGACGAAGGAAGGEGTSNASERAVKQGEAFAMRHSITLADLQARFHLPLTEAAKSLGICATILKKVSRAFGVRRWPHRGLKRLHGTLALMEESLNSPGDGDPQLKAQLEREHARLKKERDLILSGTGAVMTRGVAGENWSVREQERAIRRQQKAALAAEPDAAAGASARCKGDDDGLAAFCTAAVQQQEQIVGLN